MNDQSVDSLHTDDSKPTIRCIYLKDLDKNRWTPERVDPRDASDEKAP